MSTAHSRRLTRCTETELRALVAQYPRPLLLVEDRYVDSWIGTVAIGGRYPRLWRWPPGVRVRMTADYRERQGRVFGEWITQAEGRVHGTTDLGATIVIWSNTEWCERWAHPPEGLEAVG